MKSFGQLLKVNFHGKYASEWSLGDQCLKQPRVMLCWSTRHRNSTVFALENSQSCDGSMKRASHFETLCYPIWHRIKMVIQYKVCLPSWHLRHPQRLHNLLYMNLRCNNKSVYAVNGKRASLFHFGIEWKWWSSFRILYHFLHSLYKCMGRSLKVPIENMQW